MSAYTYTNAYTRTQVVVDQIEYSLTRLASTMTGGQDLPRRRAAMARGGRASISNGTGGASMRSRPGSAGPPIPMCGSSSFRQ